MNTQEKRYPRRIPGWGMGVENYWLIKAPNTTVFMTSFQDKGLKEYPSVYDEDRLDRLIAEGKLVETFDHLPSLPEKENRTVVNHSFADAFMGPKCPMDVCLAPQRLKVLEDFYKEVCRIQNEESGNMRVGLALSRAIAKVHNNE